MDDAAELQREVERVRASGVLGEARLRLLFDYLVEQSLAGQCPKEVAIAMDVFGKAAGFDVGQDSLVRVYIHKLRRTLEGYYARRADPTSPTIQLPRGEYRLRLSETPLPAAAEESEPPPPASPPAPQAAPRAPASWLRRWHYPAGLALALLAGLSLAWLRTPHSDLDEVRDNPLWSTILADDRPILVVVGDYYLIGDADDGLEVKRLIREFSVNSRSELDDYVQQHPEVAEHYMDVGLRYLPPASAYALSSVMAVLAPQHRRVAVSLVSDMQPATLASCDIVYIGYLSGLGMMRDLVFSGSRFAIGDSYDELIDRKTRHSYVSQTGARLLSVPDGSGSDTSYHDYGIFETFRGPGGNHIVVIAGTRDAGVRQTAATVTSAPQLAQLQPSRALSQTFEALFEVDAFDGVNLNGKLLLQSPR
jgi:hypothetical protein